MMVEKKIDGNWVDVDCPRKKPFHSYEDHYEWYPGRNYTTFGVLANVRNGYGFAGCNTGDPVLHPISMPKGIPEDCSDDYRQECEGWNGDGHSHSFLTLKELVEYDWGRGIVLRGSVTLSEFASYIENGRPESWSEGMSRLSIIELPYEEMKYMYEAYKDQLEESQNPFNMEFTRKEIEDAGVPFILRLPKVSDNLLKKQMEATSYNITSRIEWGEDLKNMCRFLVDSLIPELKTLSGTETFEDVRIVFFFDN